MKEILMVAAAAALAGCAGGGIGSGSCNARAYSSYIGQPKGAMIGVSAVGPVRFVQPGKAVSADHEPTRLNVRLDENGIIKGFRCG